MNNKEKKSGMYSETPIIKIGKYEISEMSGPEKSDSVWIHDTVEGESGEFNKEKLIPILDKFFSDNF